MSDLLFTRSKEREKVEILEENDWEVLKIESENFLKQPLVLMPEDSCEASYFSSCSLSSSINPSSTVSNDCSSIHGRTRRAVFTVQLPGFQILVVNSAACKLMKYSSDELCSMKLAELIIDSHKHKLKNLYEKFLRFDGEIFPSNEKLLELIRKDDEIILVSLSLKKLENLDRCLVLVKEMYQKAGLMYIDKNGRILSCDENIGLMFHYDTSEIVGLSVYSLLPSINISNEDENQLKIFKQLITGRTKQGDAFPVSLAITSKNSSSEEYKIVICIITYLNGLILLNRQLSVTDCNGYFIKLLSGFSKKDILNKPILNLIPTFCEGIGFKQSNRTHCQSTHLNRANMAYCLTQNESQSDHSDNSVIDESLNCLKRKMSMLHMHDSSEQSDGSCKSFDNIDEDDELNSFFLHTSVSQASENRDIHDYPQVLFRKKMSSERKLCSNIPTSRKIGHNTADKTLDSCSANIQNLMIEEGKFSGLVLHSDGSYIRIKYQIKISAINDERFYCIWLTKDWLTFPDSNIAFKSKFVSHLKTNSVGVSLRERSCRSERCTSPSNASFISQSDENLTAGDYSTYYTNIRQIGKGAFGYVKMAFRNSDGLLVVTKFTKKQSINLSSWVFNVDLNMKIPLEISLLLMLHHPNIVKVLDVFHNEFFVQLVMEKHGAGFDLFEFINREPKCDEKLKSYIFRQIISAVHYLNSLGILHRDIKDENVIINEKFEVKLIDFGSATFKPQNETFSKFYGTLEYCSPEVLQGSSYKGPELEIWALGVTLYVLNFGDNPFYNVEETIRGQFFIPLPISEDLDSLLHCMLDKNIETRITIEKVVDHPWINQPVNIENYRFEEVVKCSKDEAFPPKFVHEINSEELLTRDTRTYSNNVEDASSSNGSLYNLAEIDDFDDNFQEMSKCSLSKLVRRKSNLSSIVCPNTPVQYKNRLCKSATAIPNRFGNSSPNSDRDYKCRESNDEDDEFFLINNFIRNLKSDSSSENDFYSLEQNLPVLGNLYESESEVQLKTRFLEEEILEKNNLSESEVCDETG